MTLLPLLVAAGLSQTAAAADDGVGIRLKLNTPLYNVTNATPVVGDNEGDTLKTTTMGLFNSNSRFEGTYLINSNIEVGVIAGLGSTNTSVDGDVQIRGSNRMLGLTGAYNFKIADGLRGYAQPMVFSARTNALDTDGELQGYGRGLVYGANAGLRIRLIKGATLDPSLEYLMGNGKAFDKDGEQTPDEDTFVKLSSFGLNLGLSIKF